MLVVESGKEGVVKSSRVDQDRDLLLRPFEKWNAVGIGMKDKQLID